MIKWNKYAWHQKLIVFVFVVAFIIVLPAWTLNSVIKKRNNVIQSKNSNLSTQVATTTKENTLVDEKEGLEVRSPDGEYIAVNELDNNENLKIYITEKWGNKLTPVYCGVFDSWTSDSKKIKIFTNGKCSSFTPDSVYYLTVKGLGENINGKVFSPNDIFVPFKSDFFGEDILDRFSSTTNTSINLNTNNKVTFGPTPNDEIHRTRNPGFAVYINDKKIGEVGGQGLAKIGFSPDGKYFVVRGRSNNGCAGMCQSLSLNIIDVINNKISWTPWPRKDSYVTSKVKILDLLPFSEFFSWEGEHSLRFTFYFVALYGLDYYRITAKEVWEYDIETKMYNLIKTLPE